MFSVRSVISSRTRLESGRWSASVGSIIVMCRLTTDGRRMTCLPTPTVAAFGRVVSGGTWMRRSQVAFAMQASRQPSASWSGSKARESSRPTGTVPSSTCTLHFLHVPWPPHVESIAIPFQLAASKTETPVGTRTLLPDGSKDRSTRASWAP